MNYRNRFVVEPGAKVRLGKIDPGFKDQHEESHDSATPEIQKPVERMTKAQYLYADGSKSLLVVLQALDAGGKDGVVRHVFTTMNPQGTLVSSFKQRNRVTKTISSGERSIAQNGFGGTNPWGDQGRRHQCEHTRCAGCWRAGSVAG